MIDLPHLPPQGLAIAHQGRRQRVALLNLRGSILVVLHRSTLGAGHDPKPGRVVVRRDDHRYLLHPRTSRLVLIERPGRHPSGETRVPTASLPDPPGSLVSGSPSGEYRWAVLSPGGDAVLAQWAGFVFGSCQTSSAYLLTLEGGPPVPVMGPARIEARPTSLAIGWTRNGRALVQVPGIGCGGHEPIRAGVYGFSSPGHGRRIARANAAAFVRMWRSDARRSRVQGKTS
jgi:hypothetical protein